MDIRRYVKRYHAYLFGSYSYLGVGDRNRKQVWANHKRKISIAMIAEGVVMEAVRDADK
jgi:hypothetical protein